MEEIKEFHIKQVLSDYQKYYEGKNPNAMRKNNGLMCLIQTEEFEKPLLRESDFGIKMDRSWPEEVDFGIPTEGMAY